MHDGEAPAIGKPAERQESGVSGLQPWERLRSA